MYRHAISVPALFTATIFLQVPDIASNTKVLSLITRAIRQATSVPTLSRKVALHGLQGTPAGEKVLLGQGEHEALPAAAWYVPVHQRAES
jgi:hypothetical protein